MQKFINQLNQLAPIIRNAIMTAILFLIALPGYMVISYVVDTSHSPSLAISLDEQIPFLPWTIAIYDWIYIIIFLPLFTVRDVKLFLAISKGFAFIIFISLTFFLFFPVKIERPEILAPKDFFEWWVYLNYKIDKPTALFPSMHVSNAIFSGLAVLYWSKKIGVPAFILSILISISTLTVKQHFIADVLAGIFLASLSYYLFLVPYIRNAGQMERKEILLHEQLSAFVPIAGILGTVFMWLIYSM